MTVLTDLDLDPGIHSWIARLEQLAPAIPGIADPDPAVQRIAARELSDRLAVDFTLPIPDGIEIDDMEIAGPGGSLRMRRYRPRAADGLVPSQLWLHGGGFYAGTIDEVLNDRLCARRALDSGVQVFSLEYRLAPEHPYPAPVLDAVAALEALIDEAERFGVDPERLGIGGNSAGAAIAASTALRLRDAEGPSLCHVDLEVPPLAMRRVGESAVDYAIGFGLDQLEQIVALYTGPAGPADANISPLDVVDLGGLPSTLIMAAEHDPLRDSGVQYAERLRHAGVPVELYIGAGHLHGTPGLTASFDGAREWQELHAGHLARAYDTRTARLAG
ncbi:alpha/beta hydrolase fold domain-containing protein [Microbacterium sp. 2FI]|uniref:alpha/beta hydrolase fold domain-containing protein n=1 Tax=Microbacterium sp. 2FI TaxID=2502193 RepID=UPI0010F51BE0|nr:alpha/beta hydrolase fold domain-containing protein [Microbacterium sp. 2FI]